MRQRGFEAVARLKEMRGMRIFKRGFEKAVEMKEGQTQIQTFRKGLIQNFSFKKKPLLKKQGFSFSTNLFFQTFLKFNQNASRKKSFTKRIYSFLAQVLSLERKCLMKKKKCKETMKNG